MKKYILYVFVAGTCGFLILTGLIPFISSFKLIGKDFPGFFLYPNHLISISLRANWQMHLKGIKSLYAIQSTDLKFNGKALPEQTPEKFTIVISDGRQKFTVHGERLRFTGEDFAFTFLLPFVIGLIFLLIGIAVIFLKFRDTSAKIFFTVSSLVALFYFGLMDANLTHRFFRLWLIFPLFATLSYVLFMKFPEEKTPKFFQVLSVPIVFTAIILIILGEIFLGEPLQFRRIIKAYIVYMGMVFVVTISLLITKLLRTEDHLIRKKIRIMIFAIILASLIPGIWAFTFPFDIPFINLDRVMLLSLAFPVITIYAILKVNVFEIDRMFQKAIGYLLLSSLVVGIYFLLVFISTLLTQGFLGIKFTVPGVIVSTLFVALIFHPLRVKVQNFVKMTVYRDEYLREKACENFILSLQTPASVNELSLKIKRELPGILPFKKVCVLVRSPAGDVLTPAHDNSNEKIEVLKLQSIQSIMREKESYSFQQNLPENLRTKWQAVLPLWVEGIMVFRDESEKIIGAVLLGNPDYPEAMGTTEFEILKRLYLPLTLAFRSSYFQRQSAIKERLATIGNVASIIIHEVKNPLGIIKVSASALKKKFSEGESGYELASFIEQEVNRMDGITRQILYYAKLKEPSFAQIDLRKVVASCVKRLEPSHQKKVKFSCRDQVKLEADEEMMEQLILNLLTNACEATPDGEVNINLYSDGKGRVKISVSDTGEGIPEHIREQIFQPFVTTKRGGTGLGLAIVKNVVEAHSGTISVEPNSPRGTVFNIMLPERQSGE